MAVVELGRPYAIGMDHYKLCPRFHPDEVVLIPKRLVAAFVCCDVYWKGSITPYFPYLKEEIFYSHTIEQLKYKDEPWAKYWFGMWRKGAIM
jgi:hypothetical protein